MAQPGIWYRKEGLSKRVNASRTMRITEMRIIKITSQGLEKQIANMKEKARIISIVLH